LAVPIGAASVSLPRDTVVSFQSAVVRQQVSEPKGFLACVLKAGDWPLETASGLVAQLVRAHA
jgi:hypothetical protein